MHECLSASLPPWAIHTSIGSNSHQVTLGPFAEKVEKRSRKDATPQRRSLRALEREDELSDEILRVKFAEALADQRPPISSEELGRRIEQWRAERLKRDAQG